MTAVANAVRNVAMIRDFRLVGSVNDRETEMPDRVWWVSADGRLIDLTPCRTDPLE